MADKMLLKLHFELLLIIGGSGKHESFTTIGLNLG
jgi:hypothetical protein